MWHVRLAESDLTPALPAGARNRTFQILVQVSVGDIMLVDGGLSTFKILSKSKRDVHMEVVDGGRMTSRCVHAALEIGSLTSTLKALAARRADCIRATCSWVPCSFSCILCPV